ncbi:GAF domain-containing protein [Streptomyces sp. L2]|uniref:helix-turn-helix domain-containing protein n=1 Tax=Streptomyces sp. L2 TaxID=2162665 RepID=UPI00101224F8|nr:GAF domain-containing protein [Streptomyces sp. L2]
MRRLVELLAEGAPDEDITAVPARARAAGAGPGDLAELEAAVASALKVRRALRQHRRREAELTALFETAGDLAGLRDLDDVLQSIVRRARMLLGTDTAYLTLPDERAGDTYMRVTDGSVSPLFQNLRLSLGEGLGGLVAQTTQPYASPDYGTDPRFLHTETIDAGVREEGLVGILGVPLLLGSSSAEGGKVIGVLFAADRRPRTFTPDETALLCSLAAHAAIAIDTARALADTRAALADLAEANAVIREHSAALQRTEEAHDRLTDLVLRGGAAGEIAAAVGELLGCAIAIIDPTGHRMAQAGDGPGLTPDDLAEAVAESRAAARAVPLGDHWVCAVLAGPELLGSLVALDRPALEDSDRRLFERAGVVTALLLLLRRTVTETENRIRGELLTEVLTAAHRDPAGLVDRGRRLGTDLEHPHLVLVAQAPARTRSKLSAAAAQHLFGRGGISAEHDETTVILLPYDGPDAAGTDPAGVARTTAGRLTYLVGAPVTVAASGPASGPVALAAAHAEARRCLRAMGVLGRTGEGASAAELGFLGVLLGDGHDVRRFVHSVLGPLLEYDAQRGTDLVRTLQAYFDCGASLTRAKDDLHIHVNTVVQRLDRIGSLLGPGWNEPDRALELQLALKLNLLSA